MGFVTQTGLHCVVSVCCCSSEQRPEPQSKLSAAKQSLIKFFAPETRLPPVACTMQVSSCSGSTKPYSCLHTLWKRGFGAVTHLSFKNLGGTHTGCFEQGCSDRVRNAPCCCTIVVFCLKHFTDISLRPPRTVSTCERGIICLF